MFAQSTKMMREAECLLNSCKICKNTSDLISNRFVFSRVRYRNVTARLPQIHDFSRLLSLSYANSVVD